jgi:putative ABC transport system permease protein
METIWTIWQDLRYGVRMLVKRPGFAVVAIITLALGIGANTAIFSVVNSVLFRPLPYRNPDRLVMVWEDHRSRGGPEKEWTSPTGFTDWRDQNGVFENVAAFQGWGTTLTGGDEPLQMQGASVSHDMFSMLGVAPSLGRSFHPEEDRLGAEKVVVLSHGLWKRRFGSDPAIVGNTIPLSGENYTVIGVMPEKFKLPIPFDSEIWRPITPSLNKRCQRGCITIRVIARLKPDTTLEQAGTELGVIAQRIEEQYPETNKGVGVTINPLHEQIVGDVKPAMLVLLGAVGFVLLIACANVANISLVRAAAREREIAIRMALGAGRWRLVRQFLTESLIFSVLGGIIGLLLASWMVDLLIAISPEGTPRVDEIGIDRRVLGYTMALSIFTGLAFGIFPAIGSSKPDLNRSMKEGMGAKGGSSGRRIRGLLVVTEMALALMLLIGAGLLMKSFLNLQRVDPGFNPARVQVMNISLPRDGYPGGQQITLFYSQLLEKIKNLPEVEAVGSASSLPLSGSNTDSSFNIEGRPKPAPGQGPVGWYSQVSTDYFKTMGMRLIKGRQFTEQDSEKSVKVVVISEALARRYFPDEDPIGKRIGTEEDWLEIVGVIADVKQFGLDANARPTFYLTDRQFPSRTMSVVFRTAKETPNLAAAARREVWSIDKNLAVPEIMGMDQIVKDSISSPRFFMLLLGIFAALALLLAAIGIYGVISYSVTQRTTEIGIRIALGAQKSDILRMIMGQGMFLTALGIVIGLIGAFFITRLMASQLYGVEAVDPVTFAGVAFLLAAIAFLAGYIPARRAAQVDPMVSLRYE